MVLGPLSISVSSTERVDICGPLEAGILIDMENNSETYNITSVRMLGLRLSFLAAIHMKQTGPRTSDLGNWAGYLMAYLKTIPNYYIEEIYR